MKESVLIETNVKGLSFRINDDGVWLCLDVNKKSTLINLASFAEGKNGIIGETVRKWCTQLEHMATTENGDFKTH